jgi:hypothetical protein
VTTISQSRTPAPAAIRRRNRRFDDVKTAFLASRIWH